MKVVRSSPLRTGRLYHSFLEAESTPGHMVSSVASEKKFPVTSLGIDPETLRLVAQCRNHYRHMLCALLNYLLVLCVNMRVRRVVVFHYERCCASGTAVFLVLCYTVPSYPLSIYAAIFSNVTPRMITVLYYSRVFVVIFLYLNHTFVILYTLTDFGGFGAVKIQSVEVDCCSWGSTGCGMKLTSLQSRCRGQECVELRLHSSMSSQRPCLIKHRDNFILPY
jgi:hypothetical protein